MTIEVVTAAALGFWDRNTAIVMVAIAGCESSFNPVAQGDHLSTLPPHLVELFAPFSCNGYTSIGAWQINMPSWSDYLRSLTGSTDPCAWRDFLVNVTNNAFVANHVLQVQGLTAWSCYNNGAYQQFLAAATAEVDRQLGQVPGPVPGPPPPGGGGPLPPHPAGLPMPAPVEPPFPAISDVLFLQPVPPP